MFYMAYSGIAATSSVTVLQSKEEGAIVIATEKFLNIAKVMVDKSRKTFLY